MSREIIKILNNKQKLRDLTLEEKRAGENVMRQCLGVKEGESVLVVTDKGLVDIEAAIFFESAKKFTDKVELVEIVPRTEHAQEPPKKVAEMMSKSDVSLLVTSYSLSHTQARLKACRNGTRIASMPTITREIILRTLILDYKKVANFSKKIASILTAGEKIHLRSENGTDLNLELIGRSAIADTGLFTNKGDFGNLPAGEAFIAPLEGKSEGIVVFDGCFADIKLDIPIKITVKKGKAAKIEGGQAARLLNKRLAKVGKLGYNIAEFGIGTNKKCRLGDNLLEVEKVYGTAHLALGNNATFGGEVDVPFHADGVILNPTVKIDDEFILKEGKFTI